MAKKRFYITTPIYYPSGDPHIGHAYCTTICDVFARGKRSRGYECYFLTGTDEHGQKIEQNALAEGKTPQAYVDEKVEVFKKLWSAMQIANDDFIRTTQKRHIKVVQNVFSTFFKQDDIYLGYYEGWYCKYCESFWTDTQVGEEHLCPECKREVKKEKEEAYFFKTKKYLDSLKKFLNKEKAVTPTSRRNEMVNTFIKPGLDDLCVSRTTFKWGVPLKENKKHVSYVWVDALVNYISALGYSTTKDELFRKYWEDEESEIIHVLGADITRFHVIYWPEFLTALNIRLPDREFVHGLLMMKDGKMSKSKGNVVSPYPLIEKYGVDALRYYLVREINFGNDGQFTPEQFVERINLDLVNNLGNLLNRTISMIEKYNKGKIPAYIDKFDINIDDLHNFCLKTIDKFEILFDDLQITNAYIEVFEMLSRANKFIEDIKPWSLAKEENSKELLNQVLHILAYSIFVGGKLLEPILVNKSYEIYKQLGLTKTKAVYSSIKDIHILDNLKIKKDEPLFPRLDVAKEVEYIKNLMVSK